MSVDWQRQSPWPINPPISQFGKAVLKTLDNPMLSPLTVTAGKVRLCARIDNRPFIKDFNFQFEHLYFFKSLVPLIKEKLSEPPSKEQVDKSFYKSIELTFHLFLKTYYGQYYWFWQTFCFSDGKPQEDSVVRQRLTREQLEHDFNKKQTHFPDCDWNFEFLDKHGNFVAPVQILKQLR